METISANMLLIDGTNMDISEIVYKVLPRPTGFEEVNANVTQEAELVEVNDKAVLVLVTRRVNFEPSCIFDLKVSIKATLFLEDKSLANFDNDLEKLEEYAKAKTDVLVKKCGVGNFLSCLISQVTGSCGNTPFITPPNIKDK